MAADTAAVKIATTPSLTADTLHTINLTGKVGHRAELCHHGDDTDVVYFEVAGTEGALTSFDLGDAEVDVLLAGERLVIGVPRDDLWVRVRSAGTPKVTLRAL